MSENSVLGRRKIAILARGQPMLPPNTAPSQNIASWGFYLAAVYGKLRYAGARFMPLAVDVDVDAARKRQNAQ